MDSNIHIDPATFQFPDPPLNSLEKDSSQLTRPKSHFSKALEPRSPGFSYGRELDQGNRWGELIDARRLNKQICHELAKGPPSAALEEKPPEFRKRSLKTIFRSRSNRKSSVEKKKIPVATLQTSDGRKYGQILSGQMYDSSCNASTYQINESRRPLDPRANEAQRKHPTASMENGNVNPAIHQVDGSKRPLGEHSAHKSSESGEDQPQLSPCQTIEYSDAIAKSPENRILMDRPINGNKAAGRTDPNRPKPLNAIASLQTSPRKSTIDDSLGLLRDLSQILSRGDATVLTAGASQIPGPEIELRPTVRDFAADGSTPFSRARAAIRHRSRSPAKKASKQTKVPVTPDRPLNAVTHDSQSANPPGRIPNCIILPPMGFKEQARPPLAPPLATNPEQVSGAKTSPVRHYHSKAPSVMSAESTAEDIQSDASSGVISNAQSAIFVKIPPLPGPAPLTPLPSLPEGLDNFVPATPRASLSSQRLASPESSPPKVPPPKSPARSQYRLYPSVDSSPPKRPSSPIRLNAASNSEQAVPQASPPLRSKRRGISFPRSDHLPTSMSVGTLDEPEQWKIERSENTRQKKLRDLGRMGSHNATIEEVEPVTRNAVDEEIYHEGAAELPSPRDSYSPALSLLKHRPQPSQVSNLTARTTLQYRESSTLTQKLSPIIVVAEQAPVSPLLRKSFQKSQSNGKSVEDQSRGFKTNGFYPVPPHLASPALQGPEDDSRVRPISSHSLPIPRPVASRIPTPHPSPFLREPSRRSSHHSSLQETNGLEKRLSAMERKNAMLERAFLAVLNTRAAFSGSVGLIGMEDASGDSSSGLSGKDCDRSSGTSGTESLYGGLENLLAQHKCSAGARWSTSSGP